MARFRRRRGSSRGRRRPSKRRSFRSSRRRRGRGTYSIPRGGIRM